MNRTILYAMDDFPVSQNRVYGNAAEALSCPRGNIRLEQDTVTGIVHNSSFDPDLMHYDENYQNEQGYSQSFRDHLEETAAIIGRYFSGMSILEIGCGKGTFLELMRSRGFSITGVDPAYEGHSRYVVKDVFSHHLGISGDAIILRHVLEHIPDPLQFLWTVRNANGGKGLVYIEVPCLDWILCHKAWFDIYYEHVNYFRLSDFPRFFENILESGKTFGGQYLYVIADLATLRDSPRTHFQHIVFPGDFAAGIDRTAELMKTGSPKNFIVWGASSKGVIFSFLLLRKWKVTPDVVIDINPAKQGQYLPATALPVLSPADGLAQANPGDAVFVMNSNYFEEIRSLAGNKLTYYKVDENEF
ncbi:MAG TPA: methyltransferase domain-containing protein [Deltaproteobacteria bacterium]|nr:methyltransferase domain-containing protein [Deltaproteobacteria bacterium]